MAQQQKTKGILATVLLVAILLWTALAPIQGVYADPPTPGEGVMLELKADVSDLGPGASVSAEAAIQTLDATTLEAVADTTIAQGKPNKNYWSAWEGDAIKVGYDGDSGEGKLRGLVRFDLSSIPAGSTINSAQLQLYYGSWLDYEGHSRRVTTYRVTEPWLEDLVTWNNRPDFAESYGFVDLVAGGQGDFHYYNWTVTDLVQGWVDGTYDNHGILLRGDETIGYRGFFSWESGSDVTPLLVVNFDPPPPTLSAWPNPLDFVLDEAGTENQPLIVSNVGTGALTWSAFVQGGASWLALDDTGGSGVGFLSPEAIGVTVDTGGLAPGVYEDQVRVTSSTPGVADSPQQVQVRLSYGVSAYEHHAYLPIVLKGSGSTTPSPGSTFGGFAAVVVGIADYEHMEPATGARAGAPGIDPAYTAFDAGKAAYTNRHIGRGSCMCGSAAASIASFQDDNILLLTDSQATKTAIRDAITKWLDVREDEDTLVMFFFSGHGMYDWDDDSDENDQFDEFLVPYDVDCDPCYPEVEDPVWLSETAISDDELDSWLDELESDRIVIVIDSCFSGGMVEATAGAARTLSLGTRTVDGLGPLQVGDGFAMDVEETGRLVLMASREDQESWEFGALKDGVFSYYFIKALWSSSADLNGDGVVSAEEAFLYLNSRVDSYVFTETGYHQYPQMYDGIQGEVGLTYPGCY